MRAITRPVTRTLRPVGGIPSPSPVCVPCSTSRAPHHVAFRDRIFHVNTDVAEGIAQISDKGLEVSRSVKIRIGFTDSMRYALGREQLVDDVLGALVPDLFKPAVNGGFDGFRHMSEKCVTRWRGAV